MENTRIEQENQSHVRVRTRAMEKLLIFLKKSAILIRTLRFSRDSCSIFLRALPLLPLLLLNFRPPRCPLNIKDGGRSRHSLIRIASAYIGFTSVMAGIQTKIRS